MILKLLTLAALAGTVAACMPSKDGSVLHGATADSTVQASLATSPVEQSPVSSDGHRDAPGAAPHSHDEQPIYGEPADPNKPARTVEITMSETDDGQMLFTPSTVQAHAGEQVRFKVRNAGELEHEFVLATAEANQKHALEMQKNPDMEHDDPNAKRLAPKQQSEIVWRFSKRGTFEFGCLIPGHREAGMTGTIIVK